MSGEEVDLFNAYNRARLLELQASRPDYEDWSAGLLASIGGLSPMALLTESFGLLDVVFLVLGVATAFRLGSRMESA